MNMYLVIDTDSENGASALCKKSSPWLFECKMKGQALVYGDHGKLLKMLQNFEHKIYKIGQNVHQWQCIEGIYWKENCQD